MYRVQEAQLRDHRQQKETAKEAREEKVLPVVRYAHLAQGNEVV
jgi:hypothetical protein